MSEAAGVLILGAGQAGAQAVHSLRLAGYEGAITLAGDEAHPPYQRPPLSKAYLLGALPGDDLPLKPSDFWTAMDATLTLGAGAVAIDRDDKIVAFADGATIRYDALILATGARARTLSLPGGELSGIATLRGWDDADRLKAMLPAAANVVVVGGGFIGLEIAAAARTAGATTTVLEAAPRLLARTCGHAISDFYAREHEARGVGVRLASPPAAFEGDGRLEAVTLVDGTRLDAALVVVGVGAVPNAELALSAGLECGDGIIVDDAGRTNDPSIFAIGDVAASWSPLYGRRMRLESVQNAIDGAKAVAAAITGRPAPPVSAPWNWSDQYDLKLQIAGAADSFEGEIIRGDPESRSFAAFYMKDGRLEGCDAVNAPSEFAAARLLIAKRTPLDPAALIDTSVPMKSFLKPA